MSWRREKRGSNMAKRGRRVSAKGSNVGRDADLTRADYALITEGKDCGRPEPVHERHTRLAAEGRLPPLAERLRALGPTADERIPMLEDRLAEMDEHVMAGERWHLAQRLGHGLGALITVGLSLAWILYTDVPGVVREVLRAVLGGR